MIWISFNSRPAVIRFVIMNSGYQQWLDCANIFPAYLNLWYRWNVWLRRTLSDHRSLTQQFVCCKRCPPGMVQRESRLAGLSCGLQVCYPVPNAVGGHCASYMARMSHVTVESAPFHRRWGWSFPNRRSIIARCEIKILRVSLVCIWQLTAHFCRVLIPGVLGV